MEPIKDITCAVCGGVVYDKAHYTAVEGDLVVHLGSHECAEAVAKCQRLTGCTLAEAVKKPE